MPYTDFHYTPTGTGVISGKEVLEQTEDAINDLGGQISGDVQTAIDTANNALNVANTASNDAQNAVNTANTAHTAATNAQNTANAAQNTASNALTAAQNAQNDVNVLGSRVTTAENNITQNTTDISGLTTRMGAAEGNITTLQNDVITAQGTATSAQNTATLARGQAYVVRYASVAVSDNSTVPYANLNNVDNIKANDLLLDINGKLYQISSVDTANETVSVTTPLTQLAVDANVMHLSGNEDVNGTKTFKDNTFINSLNFTNEVPSPSSSNSSVMPIITTITYSDSSPSVQARLNLRVTADGVKSFYPHENNQYSFGLLSRRFKEIYAYSLKVTSDINGINPGALSLPDLDNAIDISGYITNLTGEVENTYTPLVNGWLCVRIVGDGLSVRQGDLACTNTYVTSTSGDRWAESSLPVSKNVQVFIRCRSGTSVVSAKFYPCQGNV